MAKTNISTIEKELKEIVEFSDLKVKINVVDDSDDPFECFHVSGTEKQTKPKSTLCVSFGSHYLEKVLEYGLKNGFKVNSLNAWLFDHSGELELDIMFWRPITQDKEIELLV
jgi:hypothetical protein